MRLPRSCAALLLLILATAASAAVGQRLVSVGWSGLKRPSRYGPRAPELIVPAELPGRQTLLSFAAPDGGGGAAIVEEGARRYVDPRAAGSNRVRAWEGFTGVFQVAPVGTAADTAGGGGAYDRIADRAAAGYAHRLSNLGLPSFRPDNAEAARAAVDILAADYLPRLLPEPEREFGSWRALLALCRGLGWTARVGFGIVRHGYFGTAARATWLEVRLPGAGWTLATAPGGYPYADAADGTLTVLTFGFLAAPGSLPEETAAVPGYAEPVVEAWFGSRGAVRVGDAGAALFAYAFRFYGEDDERFVAEVEALLAYTPEDFRARLYRAVALSRLGRRDEAQVAFERLLRRHRELATEDFAHLIWAFAKHVAWGGDTVLALRFVNDADEVLGSDHYRRRLLEDADWAALREAAREK